MRLVVMTPLRPATALTGLLAGFMLAGLLVLIGSNAQAVTVSGLYEGTVRVTDRSEGARASAFIAALNVVLTKVSGRSDASARLGAAVNNAGRYVQRYSYLANGLMEVGFDSAAINGLLEQAGLPLWERERPATLVLYPATLHGMREARMATEQTAKTRGVPIVWASAETSEQFPSANLPRLQELASNYDAVAVLVARDSGASGPTGLRWQMVFNGAIQEQSGSAEDGPNLAAEVLSRYYAAAGKEATRLFMDVSGMDNLDAYGKTLKYLGDLLMVRSVAVESLQRDVLRVRLDLRGNQEALRRALALDHKLVEQATDRVGSGAGPTPVSPVVLNYRYTP